jgi:hypothetical protein
VTEGTCFAQLALLVLTALFHVGLAQFFVEVALSEFPVGLSHICGSAGQAKCCVEKNLGFFLFCWTSD